MANIVETEAKMRKRGRWLCRTGWAAFGISLVLPSFHVFDWLSGLDCFRTVYLIAWDVIRGNDGLGRDLGSIYYSGFALANAILVASPLYMRFFRRDLRWLRRGALTLAAATLYSASLFAFALPRGWTAVGDLHVGYYVWLVSFGLVTGGALHLSLRRSNKIIIQRPSVTSRTKEEILAMRELAEYLNGEDPVAVQQQAELPWVPGDIEEEGAEQRVAELPNVISSVLASA